ITGPPFLAPLLSCSWYSILYSEKASVTDSVGVSPELEPEGDTEDTITSFSSIFRKSTELSPPALRQVSTASLMWVPMQQAIISLGVALSTWWVKCRSPMFTLPAPPPVEWPNEVVCCMFQEKLSSWIWP